MIIERSLKKIRKYRFAALITIPFLSLIAVEDTAHQQPAPVVNETTPVSLLSNGTDSSYEYEPKHIIVYKHPPKPEETGKTTESGKTENDKSGNSPNIGRGGYGHYTNAHHQNAVKQAAAVKDDQERYDSQVIEANIKVMGSAIKTTQSKIAEVELKRGFVSKNLESILQKQNLATQQLSAVNMTLDGLISDFSDGRFVTPGTGVVITNIPPTKAFKGSTQATKQHLAKTYASENGPQVLSKRMLDAMSMHQKKALSHNARDIIASNADMPKAVKGFISKAAAGMEPTIDQWQLSSFESNPNSSVGHEIRSLWQDIEASKGRVLPERKVFYKDAKVSTILADQLAINNQPKAASSMVETGKVLLSISLGIFPVTSVSLSLANLVSGRDVITGNSLSSFEMTFEAANLITLGMGGPIKAGLASLFKVGARFGSLVAKGGRVGKAMRPARLMAASALSWFRKGDEVVKNVSQKWDSVHSLLHVIKGNYKKFSDASGSTIKLAGGLHTKMGLSHFIKVNKNVGRSFETKLVKSLPDVAPEGKILVQKLENGVRRVLFPRSAMNRRGWNNSGIKVNGRFIEGGKTLWPDSFTVTDIAQAARSAIAKHKGVTGPAKLPGVFKRIKFEVRIDSDGLVKTCFPIH